MIRDTRFELATTPLVFGAGSIDGLGERARRLGRRAWVVTGGSAADRSGLWSRIEALLAASGVGVARQRVPSEPDTHAVDAGCRGARDAACDLVIGVGGGSVLDAAKAVACLIANGGQAIDYLEVVGRGQSIDRPSIPFIAVPTTGGTGSETTRNAVITDPATGTKASIRHEHLLPRLAVLDPELTTSVPPEVTASTGIDALIQLIEPYVSKHANPMTDALALEGVRRATRALPRAHADGGDVEARADMMLAATWSGMALATAGLGVAHAFAGPLGGTYPVPHGVACAATMTHGMAANLRAAERDSRPDTVRRYADIARAMGASDRDSDAATAHAAVERVGELVRALRLPTLGNLGVTRAAIPDLVARAKRTSSMRANPIDLTDDDLAEILERAIG